MGPITLAVFGAATVVTGLAVVVEFKKHREMKRLNDLLEMQMRATGVIVDPPDEWDIHNIGGMDRAKRMADDLLRKAGYTKTPPMADEPEAAS